MSGPWWAPKPDTQIYGVQKWWSDSYGFVRDGYVFMAVGLLLLSIIVGIVVACNALGRASCNQTADQMEVRAQYSIMTGCLVQVRGKWIPLDNYRVLD